MNTKRLKILNQKKRSYHPTLFYYLRMISVKNGFNLTTKETKLMMGPVWKWEKFSSFVIPNTRDTKCGKMMDRKGVTCLSIPFQ